MALKSIPMTAATITKKRLIILPTLPDVIVSLGLADHPPFERHVHMSYHLGIVFQGAQRFWHKGSQHYLTGTSIATINPDEAHDGYSVTESGYRHGVLQFSEKTLIALFGDRRERFFNHSLHQSDHDTHQLCRIFQSLTRLSQDAEQLALLTEAIKLLLGNLIGSTVCADTPTTAQVRALRSLKQFMKRCILDDPQRTLPLTELAQRVHYSQYQLIRHFKKCFGITPYAYQLCLRLEQAKAHLIDGQPIIDIAHQQGFSDQSHFTRCFRRAFFLTPAQFQKQLQ